MDSDGEGSTGVSKMHADEVETSVGLVCGLIKDQFPAWAGLEVKRLPSPGTDNVLFRLGQDMVARLPRIHWAQGQADLESHWLPKFSPDLPLQIPTPLAKGKPSAEYPYSWSVSRWIEGQSATHSNMKDLSEAAGQIANFLKVFQGLDTTGAPTAPRGLPLQARDEWTRKTIMELGSSIDMDAALAIWEHAVNAPPWSNLPVWVHGDVLPGNILVRDGRVAAVIDFGGLGIGDPACDLMIAWSLFQGESRRAFRRAMDVDDATWLRGKGHALSQAALFIPYYEISNPAGTARARHAIREILEEGLDL